jgi:hypothetical protein
MSMKMSMNTFLTLAMGVVLLSCDNRRSQSDGAVDFTTGSDFVVSDSSPTPDHPPTSRTINGTISDPIVNSVAAIPEKVGKETIAAVTGGAFVLSKLRTDERYLLEFRNGATSQGYLTFSAGAIKAWVIPRGTQDIDLGKCGSDEHLSFNSANSPLDSTDDDSDGIVDSKDNYAPTPATLPSTGTYEGIQLWNLLKYGIAFVPDSVDKSKWTIFLSGSAVAPDCMMPISGVMEQFGDGFIGLFQVQYLVAADCKVHDHSQFRMIKQTDGSYLGTTIHFLVGLDSTCVPVGCMGTPPHGGDYKMTRMGDSACK